MSTTPPLERRTMSVEEAAVALGIGRTTAYLAIRRGELPCLRIGRRVVVPRAAIDRLLAGANPLPPSLTAQHEQPHGEPDRRR
jgi:excisionase family DNA binding protein